MADTKLKCAACGKVSAITAFEAGGRGEHELEALDVDYVGGGRAGRPKDEAGKLLPGGKGGGFAYQRRAMAPEESAIVLAATETAAARLRHESPPDSRDRKLAAELVKLRKRNAQLTKTLRLAQIEIRRLHGAAT